MKVDLLHVIGVLVTFALIATGVGAVAWYLMHLTMM
jgi:hypothetical protein